MSDRSYTVTLTVTEYDAMKERIAYLEGALRVIADGTICPDLFPNDTDENVIAAKTAMVTAIAALEHSESETCAECGGSGLTMQPGMPDGEPEGLPCPKCKKQFAPIGNGTICSNCTKTIAYHYQTAEGYLFCEVPKETKAKYCTCDHEDPFQCKCKESETAACLCICHGI